MRRVCVLLLAVAAGVVPPRRRPSNPHYVLGAPYQADGIWYYPRESYELHETGLAAVYGSGHPDLTADGEVFDQSALAAAHQTLQLPAIARMTNLENGRQVVVRINDRGPATPHRLLEVTRRTATLLGISQRRRGARAAGGAGRTRARRRPMRCPARRHLQIAAAPRGEVTQTDLPPPGSCCPGARRRVAGGRQRRASAAARRRCGCRRS